MKAKRNIVLIFLATSIFGLIISYLLYPKIHPRSGVGIELNSDNIKSRADKLAKEFNLSTKGYNIQATLQSNKDIIKQTQMMYGMSNGIKMLRNNIPGYYWRVTWHKQNAKEIFMDGGNQDQIVTALLGEFSLHLDTKGRLLELKYDLPDTVDIPTLNESDAKALAENFISRFSIYRNLEETTEIDSTKESSQDIAITFDQKGKVDTEINSKTKRVNRVDYQFTYSTKDRYLHDKVIVKVSVAGNIVSGFSTDYEIPEKYKSDDNTISGIVKVSLYIILAILLLVMMIKRIRAYEIGFKSAVITAILAVITSAISIYLSVQVPLGWEFFATIVLGPVFIGLPLILIFAVCESLGREVWSEKLVGIDLITNGHFTHSKLGENLLNGIGFGLAILGLWLFLVWILNNFFDLYAFAVSDNEVLLTGFSSVLYNFTGNFYGLLYQVPLFILAVMSIFRRRFSSLPIYLLLGAAMWAIGAQDAVYPYFANLPVQFILGIIFISIFLRFDFITAFVTIYFYKIFSEGLMLIFTPSGKIEQSGIILLVLVGLIILWALFVLFSKDRVKDLESITPVFARHITERQRMQSELEIARDVQMSFLPRKKPEIDGLSIAAECIPALEVGGDYYDFIELDKNKLGVVIGDVSGKGTRAAFYMTLAKGFLKALSRTYHSPGETLSLMNNMFYENVNRGNFISMIYGIFDLDKKMLTLARAGHNPLIVKQSSSGEVKFVQPKGIALGLEKGEIFSKSILEEEISFDFGDTFVFYTDGFTEAMNKNKEEYGEERLSKTINDNIVLSSDKLLKKIYSDVKSFIGKEKQHDDMTIVVVKID